MKSDFGFAARSTTEKTKAVQNIFARISNRYDLMNDAMSFGLHRCWKDQFVAELPLTQCAHEDIQGVFLDVAAGTGDIAKRLLKNLPYDASPSAAREIVLCDLNFSMLKEGQKRFPNTSLSWICANAEALPLNDHRVALYTIAFGLRNVTDKKRALEEAFRVLTPGGFFYCLEFSQPQSPFFAGLYDLYSFGWIPLLGALLAQDSQAYQYLVESIRTFPSPPLFQAFLQDIGFQETGFKLLFQGLAAIHWGRKP